MLSGNEYFFEKDQLQVSKEKMNYFVLFYIGKCYDTIDIKSGKVIGYLKIMTPKVSSAYPMEIAEFAGEKRDEKYFL